MTGRNADTVWQLCRPSELSFTTSRGRAALQAGSSNVNGDMRMEEMSRALTIELPCPRRPVLVRQV